MKEKTSWQLEKENSTPFDRTLNRYDRIIGEQCRENKTWRFIALFSMTAFFLSLGTMIWTVLKDSQEKRYVPLIISLSDLGEAKYHGEISKMSYSSLKVPEDAIQFQLKDFIEKTFTIPKDSTVLRSNLTKCYAYLTPGCGNKFTDEIIRKDNPLKKYGEVLRSVEIESIIKVSPSSYQVDYFLKETDFESIRILSRTKIRTVITVELNEPAEVDRVKNPLGIYISDFGSSVLQTQ